MTLREQLHVLLRREGWHAVACELVHLAERRHPQSLLTAGFRLAAAASRRGAADRQRRGRRGSAVDPPEISGALRSAPHELAGGPSSAAVRLGSELTEATGCE